MDYKQLIESRIAKIAEMQGIVSGGKDEKRKLSKFEDQAFTRLKLEIETLDVEIRSKTDNNKNTKNKTKMENRFSLLRALNARANGQPLNEVDQMVMDAGKEQMRKAGLSYTGDIVLPTEYRADITAAGSATEGKEVVATDKLQILPPLRDGMILVDAGAQLLTGLSGNISIPTYAGTTALWKGEVESAADGAGAFAEVLLSPKRLTTYIDISKQFLIQDSVSAEAMLMADISAAISDKFEQTILGSASGSTTQPAGIFYGVTDVTGATAHSTLIAMETALATGKVYGNFNFVMSPSAKGKLRTTQAGTNLPFIMDGKEVVGYNYFTTNAVPSNRIVLADWSDLVLAQFGAGYDITIDPFTVAKEGKIRLVISAYLDGKFRRAASYKTATLS